MDNTAYRQLVLSIYQAVSDPDHWEAVMDQISDLVGARGGLIIETQHRGEDTRLDTPLMTSSFDPQIVRDYFDSHRDAELRDHAVFDRALLARDSIEVLDESILYNDRDTYLMQPHVQKLASLGVAHRTGAILDKDNPSRARFSLSLGRRRGPFSGEDIALLKDILPHLAKALELARPVGTFGQTQHTLFALFEHLDAGVCLVDVKGRIVQGNHEFRRQQDAYGLFAPDPFGRLVLPDAADQAQLVRFMADALNHGQFGARPRKEAILVRAEGAQTVLCVEVLPLPRSEDLGSEEFDGVLVISRDTSAPVEFDIALAQAVFALTATEAAVLRLVSRGLTNREIAEQRGRSVETINVQLKSILTKTRTPNRTQLVRLLCNFAAPASDGDGSD